MELVPSNFSVSTRIIRGQEEVSKALLEFGISCASDPDSPFLYAIVDKNSPRLTVDSLEGVKAFQDKYPRYRIKYITDVQKENLSFVKSLLEGGFEIGHIEGMKANIGIGPKQYLSASHSLENGIPDEIIWSDSPELIAQMTSLFSKLWEGAIPAQIRASEIERGITLGETRETFDSKEITGIFDELVQTTHNDAYIIVSSEDGLRRNTPSFQQLAKKARSGAIVRILVPPTFLVSSSFQNLKTELGLEGIEFKIAERLTSNFNLGIYDQRKMITAQYAGKDSGPGGILHGMVTSSRDTIAAMLSIFDALWHESEMRDREERSKKKAQLLQDILTHDIRNYNQVAKLSAELIVEEAQGNTGLNQIAHSMIAAIDGSTELLERAKKLGKVLAEQDPLLYPVELESTIAHAFSIVKTGASHRSIKMRTDGFVSPPRVMADELLREVFSNIFSNSVKYTDESKPVKIAVALKDPTNSDLVEIDVSDEGSGISDEMKPTLFARYLESAKGSGLGMSIVHALVVERYKGMVSVTNRVPDDYTQGTIVSIFLHRAE
jgi:two-component system, OmpR family, sensor histidine kinase VicK